jgi:hypothetical protein
LGNPSEDKSANSTFHLVSKQGSPTAIHDFAPEPKFQGVINHRYIIFANRACVTFPALVMFKGFSHHARPEHKKKLWGMRMQKLT